MINKKTPLLVLLAASLLSSTYAKEKVEPLPKLTIKKVNLPSIGAEESVMRRDPSDVIKVNGLYYVWYSKGSVAHGYNATVWYATSPDGLDWKEKGMSLDQGKKGSGSWDEASVFTPNILVAEGKYWLFFTGISANPKVAPDSKIGVAVSDSPDGPWEKLASNPVLANSANPEDFDSHLIDDACLIKRNGKYWFYYKGRQLGKSPKETMLGLAVADKPEGPYVKHEKNPLIPGNHEVVVWPEGKGVAGLIGVVGPENWIKSLVYAEDGINFHKTHDMKNVPHAGAAYRPEAFTDSGLGERIEWGVHIGHKRKYLPFIQRFEITK